MRRSWWFMRLLVYYFYVTYFRYRAFGMRHVPRTGGVLLVSNHQSFLDPVLVGLPLPRECHYMARDTLFNNRWFGWLISYLNAFPVKRGTADTGAIKETIRRLRGGYAVLTFPEGTRTRDGRIGPMRAGVVLVARKTQVPIVPTLILGAYEAWPRTAKLPRPRRMLVAFGPPLYPHRHPEWSDDACVARVREALLTLQARYARVLG